VQDYPRFDIEKVELMMSKWVEDKHEDILGYRNKAFKSLSSNVVSPERMTCWIDELDDSLDNFLK
jgi:trimethylamine monooxygenase